MISLEHVPVAAGASVAGKGYGPGLRRLRCTPSVYMRDSTQGGKTRSVGWSLNYIRASTTRQAWEPFMTFLDIYRQFSITGTQSEYGALVLFGWVGTLVEECISLNITQKVRRQGVTGWTASHKGTTTI